MWAHPCHGPNVTPTPRRTWSFVPEAMVLESCCWVMMSPIMGCVPFMGYTVPPESCLPLLLLGCSEQTLPLWTLILLASWLTSSLWTKGNRCLLLTGSLAVGFEL